MQTQKTCLVFLSLIFFATSGFAEVVKWLPCLSQGVSCTIHEVRVNPCPQASRRKPCRIRGGQEASISFDYTPDFSGDLQNTAAWQAAGQDLRFPGMSDSACNSTVCPAVPSTRQTYNYSLRLDTGYPKRDYRIKWKLFNAEKKECCFMFDIKLVK